ncbi:MAG: phosphoribosyltransferase family protein [Candidatus ainarchaeum sp.]|nr:phosphoribosyltransferase family protein [Candidatus ainarchaeum sp.]
MHSQKHYKITWSEYNQAAHTIYKKLLKEKFTPDVIIGVSKGGLVLATHLCHIFYNKHNKQIILGTIYAKRHESDCYYSKLVKPKVTMKMLPEIKNKKVLITEDTVGTGTTKECIIEYLNKKKPKKIMTAIISAQKGVNLENCVYYKINNKIWQIFPWEE